MYNELQEKELRISMLNEKKLVFMNKMVLVMWGKFDDKFFCELENI